MALEHKRKDRPKLKDGKDRGEVGPDERQVLKVLEPLEQKAVDLLVTAWCARVWHDTLEANKVQMTAKEGGTSSHDQDLLQG